MWLIVQQCVYQKHCFWVLFVVQKYRKNHSVNDSALISRRTPTFMSCGIWQVSVDRCQFYWLQWLVMQDCGVILGTHITAMSMSALFLPVSLCQTAQTKAWFQHKLLSSPWHSNLWSRHRWPIHTVLCTMGKSSFCSGYMVKLSDYLVFVVCSQCYLSAVLYYLCLWLHMNSCLCCVSYLCYGQSLV